MWSTNNSRMTNWHCIGIVLKIWKQTGGLTVLEITTLHSNTSTARFCKQCLFFFGELTLQAHCLWASDCAAHFILNPPSWDEKPHCTREENGVQGGGVVQGWSQGDLTLELGHFLLDHAVLLQSFPLSRQIAAFPAEKCWAPRVKNERKNATQVSRWW